MRKTIFLLTVIAVCGNQALAASGGTEYSDGSDTAYIGQLSTSGADVSGANVVVSRGDKEYTVVAGGQTMGGMATGNAVKLDGYESEGSNIFGGNTEGKTASGNTVTLENGAQCADITGGNGHTATNNTVVINGSSAAEVNGGRAEGGNATGNKVQLSGATGDELDITGGYAEEGQANNNQLTISESDVRALQGGKGDSEANGNVVQLESTKASSSIAGGTAKNGTASQNTVSLSNSGCTLTITGGSGKTASENTVVLSQGSTCQFDVCGGQASDVASGNTVTIAASTLEMGVTGGAAATTTVNNTINLVGKGASLNGISGGTVTIKDSLIGGTGAQSSGNTLNIYGSDIHVNDIRSIQVINFHVGTGEEQMLTLGSDLSLGSVTVDVSIETAAVGQWMQRFSSGGSVTLSNHIVVGESVTFTFGGTGVGETFSCTDSGGQVYSGTFVSLAKSISAGQVGLVLTEGVLELKGLGIDPSAPVPEPATGALSLLALAGLCARRRRK